jgi:SAM-dependent methyltransferase
MKLNLGCGERVVPGWTNVDYAIGARLARLRFVGPALSKLKILRTTWPSDIFIHDLRSGIPFADESIDVVYSSHFLEHLSRQEGAQLLRDCRRVLKPGGILRIVVPDLAAIVEKYLSKELKAERFCEELGVLSADNRDSKIKSLFAPFVRFPHQCMYDEAALLLLFNQIGIAAAPRRAFESAIGNIAEIEIEARTIEAVIVEGIKR